MNCLSEPPSHRLSHPFSIHPDSHSGGESAQSASSAAARPPNEAGSGKRPTAPRGTSDC